MSPGEQERPRTAGRYVLFHEVAHGRVSSVHLARLRGATGFSRTVVIKRLLPEFAGDLDLARKIAHEARRAARVRHPNVVAVLDVIEADGGEPWVVSEYVPGLTLAHLIKVASRQRVPMPRRVLVTIVAGILNALDAAHEARGERGEALGLVHEEVSPQKVLLGSNGVPMLFGVGHGEALRRARFLEPATTAGKLGYKAPEQLDPEAIDRRADLYAVGVMLWEGLTGRRLFDARVLSDADVVRAKHASLPPAPPSSIIPSTSKTLDDIVMKALSRARSDRFATAADMATALEEALSIVPARKVGEWVTQVAGEALAARAADVLDVEARELPSSLAAEPISIPSAALVDDVEIAERAPVSEGGDVSLLPAATTSPPRALPEGSLDLLAMPPGRLPRIGIPRIDVPGDAGGSPPEGAIARPPPSRARSSGPPLASTTVDTVRPPAPVLGPRRIGWGTVLLCAALVAAGVWMIAPQLTEGSEPDPSAPGARRTASPPPTPAAHEDPARSPPPPRDPRAVVAAEGGARATVDGGEARPGAAQP